MENICKQVVHVEAKFLHKRGQTLAHTLHGHKPGLEAALKRRGVCDVTHLADQTYHVGK